MATDDLLIRLGLRGQAEVSRGLRKTASETRDVGDAAETAGAKAVMMGAKFAQGTDHATVSVGRLVGAMGLFAGAQGLGRLTAAGVKWGLSYTAQVEQARLRFQLFTTDVDGLTKSVQAIDKASMFNFADLADAAALLGGSGIKDVPKTLQAAANAAAGGGKGTEGLKSIVLALSQIASKGRLSQEEVNQLTEGGAITAQLDLSHGLHLTAKELQNLGGQGIEAKKALDVLTKAWTTGQMADAAKRQLGTLSGQWGLLTGDAQKLSGLLTQGLARSLEKKVIPAANRATEQITEIFGNKGLSNEEKLRQARAVIERELGPVADDLKDKIDQADIPGHLGDVVAAALPQMASAAGKIAPDVAKAFVDAWMHSGPWAQIISLLFIAKKGVDAGRWAGGGKGGLGGIVGKATPVPVYITNWGKGGAGGGAGGVGVGRTLRGAARGAGLLDVAIGAEEGVRTGSLRNGINAADPTNLLNVVGLPSLHQLGSRYSGKQGWANLWHDIAGGNGQSGMTGTLPRGATPAPGFGSGTPGALNINVQVDGRTVATANARSNAKQRARN